MLAIWWSLQAVSDASSPRSRVKAYVFDALYTSDIKCHVCTGGHWQASAGRERCVGLRILVTALKSSDPLVQRHGIHAFLSESCGGSQCGSGGNTGSR